jgi:three-Cys-motif partner protein
VSSPPFEFDEIGVWSELKLEIIEKYGAAYTGTAVEGSPARALKVTPPFDGYYFIDLNEDKTDYLKSIVGNRSNVHIHTGDCNQYLTTQLLPTIQFRNFRRALCLLDPYGLHLDWEVIRQAGQSKAMDMFLNFPVMDMNRNAIWKNPDTAPADGIERMTRFWGDDSWKRVAYVESPQGSLFGPETVKVSNDAIVAAFRTRLKSAAGFEHVADPLPMKNTRNAVVYYLFLASQKPVAEKIITDIFKKYR